MNEEEEFFAWLDGELDGQAAERVAARVAVSPELAAKAEKHRMLAAGLRRAFDPVMEAAPARPSFGEGDVIDFGARAADRRRSRFALPQWAAMAATLVVGVLAGAMIGGGGGVDSPVEVESGQLVAAASLDRALDTRLAGAPAPEGTHIGLTFRDASGRICRSFSGAEASGLACREGEYWRIRGLFQGTDGQAGDYRMAAGMDPRLAALIDETIAGDPFDADKEKAALAKGWR
ncbi:MAG TPA: anti-sigma factor [Sphingomicrobium sp.]|nr:anti-sigma factor [Sphingomicrobium sp.]